MGEVVLNPLKKTKQLLSVLIIFLFLTNLSYLAAQNDNSNMQTLSLSCKGADIADVLQGISLQYGVNIIPDRDVNGSVTIHLDGAPFEEGLRTLLEINGFTYDKKGDIYLVRKKETESNNINIEVSDGLLSLDARNADVKEVTSQLSAKANVNIVTGNNLTGNITAHISNIPLDEAIKAVFSSNNFVISENAGIYYLDSRTSKQGASLTVLYSNGLLTIDVKNAPLSDVLHEISLQAKINIVTVSNVQGIVTMRLEKVTLEKALEMISISSGVAYKKVDDIYIVGDNIVKPGLENPLIEQKVIWLKYISAEELMTTLPPGISRSSVTISRDRNAIVVLGTEKNIERVEKLIKQLDIENASIRSRMQSAIWVDVLPNGMISIDVKDASIGMVVREISIKTGIDVVILEATGISLASSRTRRSTQRTSTTQRTSDESLRRIAQQTSIPSSILRPYSSSQGLSGYVNLRIESATLDEVFSNLFAGTGYTYTKRKIDEKDIYIIGTGGLASGWNNPLTVSKRISLNYIDATKVIDVLPTTFPESNITIIPDQNAIAVIGTPEMIADLEEYVSQVDLPTPQVMIEALLLELTDGSTEDLGIEFSGGKENTFLEMSDGFGLVFDSLEKIPDWFSFSLKALLAENKAKLLANPRVAVLSGGEAQIDVGAKYMFRQEIYREPFLPIQGTTGEDESQMVVPYSSGGYTTSGFNNIDTGITLNITPWVGNAGEITMDISPEITDAVGITADEAQVLERSFNTTIRVKDGGMIVIGGLIQEKEVEKEDKIPVLGKIPILEHLFSSSHKELDKSELVIVIMPKLIE